MSPAPVFGCEAEEMSKYIDTCVDHRPTPKTYDRHVPYSLLNVHVHFKTVQYIV